MRITTKGRYAIRAMVNLALSTESKPIPIKKIAEEESISPEFLEQIFFKLRKAGIIDSVRGPGGGFLISRPLESITIKDIFDAVDEGLGITPCTEEEGKSGTELCEKAERCLLYEVWKETASHLRQYFASITLKDLIDKAKKGMYEAIVEGQDFSI
ncbi:RrF2 family transcriptional regulator [Spirochaeta thermophila]|uniref:HTH-type transcriptional regulator IscR n=1 Tax=Winmispira thermophila (strain ATCC 49972 / DSM 6192 / RI 19.B1) TaxID=665571 RepID=E0RTI1_WINT6|nr:Rrf2 family transcriptional regulator [Spirochaeta thermophila]ADN02212.1 HTH-type transcriptional regulator IscR [Spirochaeta thermophila DSM 6192]